jgi:hypothetical protein
VLNPELFYESWVDDYYPNRPPQLENMHLYYFVCYFDVVTCQPKRCKDSSIFHLGRNKLVKRRARPYLYKYSAEQIPEQYFYSLLLMFKPWRSAQQLLNGFNTYTEAFHAIKDELKEAVNYASLQNTLRENFEHAWELIDKKNGRSYW